MRFIILAACAAIAACAAPKQKAQTLEIPNAFVRINETSVFEWTGSRSGSNQKIGECKMSVDKKANEIILELPWPATIVSVDFYEDEQACQTRMIGPNKYGIKPIQNHVENVVVVWLKR